eukprot:jgi/Tetstr1/456055/TSEL_042825.t1
MAQRGGDPSAVGSGTPSRRRPPGSQHYAPNQIMGDLSAVEERIYEEREDARTIAGGLRKETTPRHERFDGATSKWTEWFNSYNVNVLIFSPADSLQLLQEYVEVNAVTRPIIDQWQKDTQRYQQPTPRFDPASGRIRVPSREGADAFHDFRYRRYVELFETKFNEAPKMRTRSYGAEVSTALRHGVTERLTQDTLRLR